MFFRLFLPLRASSDSSERGCLVFTGPTVSCCCQLSLDSLDRFGSKYRYGVEIDALIKSGDVLAVCAGGGRGGLVAAYALAGAIHTIVSEMTRAMSLRAFAIFYHLLLHYLSCRCCFCPIYEASLAKSRKDQIR